MIWHFHNGATREHLGLIPAFLSDHDPRPAAEQFNEAYAHGGGWSSFGKGKWKLQFTGDYATSKLVYPGDPAFKCIAHTVLHESSRNDAELVLVFTGGPWVVVKKFTSDEFDVARMD